MKGLMTLAMLGAAGFAAWWTYGKWFKKPSATTVTPGGTVRVQPMLPPSIEGLSGSRPIGVF